MVKVHGFLLSAVMISLLFTSADAATAVPCSDPSAQSRTIETVSFATPYCYGTITDAYTSWYSLELYARNLSMTDPGVVFNFSPDGQTIRFAGGYDSTWNPTTGHTVIPSLTITGSAVVSVSNITIQ